MAVVGGREEETINLKAVVGWQDCCCFIEGIIMQNVIWYLHS